MRIAKLPPFTYRSGLTVVGIYWPITFERLTYYYKKKILTINHDHEVMIENSELELSEYRIQIYRIII